MTSDDENCAYLNEENVEIEYIEHTHQDMKEIILENPLAAVDMADELGEPNYENNEAKEIPLDMSSIEEYTKKFTRSKVSEDTWDEDKAILLLKMYLQIAEKFRNPKIKKKLLWARIGAVINKDADACDKKFRNLKQHYITIVGKRRRCGSNSAVRWPFFNLFEQISKKVGCDFSERLNYRPILKKPEWDAPQFLMLGNSNSLRTPIIVNSVTPVNNGLSVIDNGFVSNTVLQRKRKIKEEKVSEDSKTSKTNVEEKLDRLVRAVEESNNIQRERNKLFQEYLKKIK